jgi:predicted esterase
MKQILSIVCVGCLTWTGVASAQQDRYEVGQHLRAFETTFEAYWDKLADRKRAVPHLWRATPYFFASRWGDAAKALDDARLALLSENEATPEVAWAESLYIQPEQRLLDTGAKVLRVNLKQFYKIDKPMPKESQIRFTLFTETGKNLAESGPVAIQQLPDNYVLQLQLDQVPEGDYRLRVEVLVAGKVVAGEEQTVSFAATLGKRLTALAQGVRALPNKNQSVEGESVKELESLLADLGAGETLETDYPAARLLAEAESALAAVQAGKTYYGGDKTGQFWLALPVEKGSIPARLFVPEEANQGKPLPVVVALHGVGTTENMFFEAYGRGQIVELCRKRGWLLVSPRSPSFVFRSPVAEIVDALAGRYPVDKSKVFVIGHSMGAAQAVAAVQETPDRIAAVAALGGSGRVNGGGKIKEVPFFVGVGENDFALEGSRQLAKNLRKDGVATVDFHEYPGIEHVTIVQMALAEVFAFYDRIARPNK